jgi:hypothetical protein
MSVNKSGSAEAPVETLQGEFKTNMKKGEKKGGRGADIEEPERHKTNRRTKRGKNKTTR